MPIDFIFDDKDSESTIDKEAQDSFEKDIIKAIMEELKDQVINMVIPSLGPKNFEGEAIQYMKAKLIPLTENGLAAIPGVQDAQLGVKQYSQLILKEFIDNVDKMIVYDEQENTILISPFIDSLEYGDFYRPTLKTITKAIEAVLPDAG
ncbi:MAG: hypothetical protein JHC33_03300 [Ignisphaera sp.]|nr:hypothetical protein [Ignisphaera sp.]